MARHLHDAVCGAGRPFVHVNCGSIPESLFESELFGYERGAFTGALQAGKKGLIDETKPELLHRSDFFGGLGWMMSRKLWTEELMQKWPKSYWDD